MPNYKESTVSGLEWQRAEAISIYNRHNETPVAHYAEEKIITVGERVLHERCGGIDLVFDPAVTFPLYNPTTGDPLTTTEAEAIFSSLLAGTGTHTQIQVLLYSLYITEATARDIREQEDAEETPIEEEV